MFSFNDESLGPLSLALREWLLIWLGLYRLRWRCSSILSITIGCLAGVATEKALDILHHRGSVALTIFTSPALSH